MATECSESKSHYDRPQPCHTVRAVNCDRHSVRTTSSIYGVRPPKNKGAMNYSYDFKAKSMTNLLIQSQSNMQDGGAL